MNLRFGHDEHFATAATRCLIDRAIARASAPWWRPVAILGREG